MATHRNKPILRDDELLDAEEIARAEPPKQIKGDIVKYLMLYEELYGRLPDWVDEEGSQ